MSGLLGSIGVRIAVVGVFIVGGFLFRDLLPGGADDLRVGDCFEEPNLGEPVDEVQHHPCTEEHDAEVIFVGEHPAREGAAVLTEDEEGEYITANCLPAFAAYTGQDYMSQQVLDIGYFLPLPEGWREGDRTYICWAYRLDNQTMSQSVKTSSR
jgi:hypothetical protein